MMYIYIKFKFVQNSFFKHGILLLLFLYMQDDHNSFKMNSWWETRTCWPEAGPVMLMLIHSLVCFSSNSCLMWRPADFEACREEEAKLQSSSDSSQEHGHQTAQEMRLARAGLVSYARIRSRPLRLYFPSLPCSPRFPSRAAARILEESLLISQTAFYSHFRMTYQFDTSIEIQEDF